jgi:adenylate cyclase
MTVMNLVSFAVVNALLILIMATVVISWQEIGIIFGAITPRYVVSVFVWQVLVLWGINFWLEIQRVIGSENLLRLVTGRFRRPREETRVFLFMDLKGSTELAEKLGHRQFSEMLQECYQDLTQVALRFEATIYQYVGDEVIMSWQSLRREDGRHNSVKAFFAYEQQLEARKEEYCARFGTTPEFRGGIDVGPVMAAEVGDVKREIVFHGDVLNTASRLLELCKLREDRLIVSDSVGQSVQQDTNYRSNWTEDVSLRGKKGRVKASSLQPSKECKPAIVAHA